jgi:hypothetical protein
MDTWVIISLMQDDPITCRSLKEKDVNVNVM